MFRAARLFPAILIGFLLTGPIHAASQNIVIGQIYGGGGNSGATIRNDFIELFNRGSLPISVAGWTVQYASASGSSWVSTALTGTIQPGRYYLVQEEQGNSGTVSLPQPDAVGSIGISAMAGKVALVNSSTLLTGTCPSSSSIVDFVGYGSANCSEGTPAPGLNNTTAILRADSGCSDTDSNSSNFSTGSPSPRNSSSAANQCGGIPSATSPSGSASALPASVTAGGTVLLVVTVTPGADPTSTGIVVNGNLSPIGSSASQVFFDDGTNGDAIAGDNRFSFQVSLSNSTPSGPQTIPITISDAQARNGTAAIQLSVTAIGPGPSADEVYLVFPHIADGGGYRTILLLTNQTAVPSDATLSFFSSSGVPLTVTIGSTTSSTFSLQIAARGSLKLETSGTSPSISTGWAKLTHSMAVQLSGNAIFQLFKGSALFSEASVPATYPAATADFFVDESGGFNTGFAMANPGSGTTMGQLTLRSTTGLASGTYPFSLPSGQHTAVFLFQVLPGASSGRAEISITKGSLAIVALRFHSSSIFSTVSVATPGYAPAATTALFSPNGGVRARIVSEIDRAQSTLDLAIYSFTSDEIRNALARARTRGVTIRIIADTSQANGQGSEIANLESMGFNLKRSSGDSGGIMHNKYMIVDSSLLLTGSYNWSANAEDNNFENAVFIQASPLVQNYISDFNRIWAR
jgi:PLD-like domain/Lamin Tail Domain